MQPMNKKITIIGKNLKWFGLGAGISTMLLPLVLVGIFWGIYRNKVLPGVSVGGVKVGGLNQNETVAVISKSRDEFKKQEWQWVEIKTASDAAAIKYRVNFEELQADWLVEETMKKAYDYGRQGSLYQRWLAIVSAIKDEVDLDYEFVYNSDKWNQVLNQISEDVDVPGAEPSVDLIKVDGVENVEAFLGEDGKHLEKEEFTRLMVKRLSQLDKMPITVELKTEKNQISPSLAAIVKKRAERLLDKELKLVLNLDGSKQESWVLTGKEVVALLGMDGGFETEKIREYVGGLAPAINREPQNALFKFENGRVVEFAPSLSGVNLVKGPTIERISAGLEEMEKLSTNQEVEVVAELTNPEVNTPDVNNLGIKELIGVGESWYSHSIPGRVHNVALTASRLNGVLVAPGETFSFNKTIGDVSAATGYKSAYIIKDGRTILGDGGGVCQDSTTLFRALLDAGLPIIERQSHAYRVSYYEQKNKPGFDATVYAPSPDLKFKNDTPGHILIQATTDTKNYYLKVELYGTSDGRKSEIINYKQWAAVPAPPPLYQDDPTIPSGTVKQVDWASPGLKVKFDYVVTRNGETIFEKTFASNYRPWQAVYLKGI